MGLRNNANNSAGERYLSPVEHAVLCVVTQLSWFGRLPHTVHLMKVNTCCVVLWFTSRTIVSALFIPYMDMTW